MNYKIELNLIDIARKMGIDKDILRSNAAAFTSKSEKL
jgi:hypothetical protein